MAEPVHRKDVDPRHRENVSRIGTLNLFKEVRRIMAVRHGFDGRLLTLLRELDKRKSIDGRPFSLAAWLAQTFGLGYGAAREKVRTARALGFLPLIDAAFLDGKLSYSKVRALTRVACEENEARLLEIALDSSADAVETVVQRYRQRACLDDVQQMLRARSLTYAWDADGSLVVKARLAPDQGAIWLKALEKALEKAEAALDADPDEEFQIRQADAMTLALEESLLDGSIRGEVSSSVDRPRVADHYQTVVHVSAETLSRVPAETRPELKPELKPDLKPDLKREARIENGPILHPETVRRLTCDGALVSVLRGDAGEVLNVGRKTRVIPRAIRRALKARDERCQYPGCHRTRYLAGHHIVHWAHGGSTKLDNLILLCSQHHRYVHEFGLGVEKTERGFRFAVRAGPEIP